MGKRALGPEVCKGLGRKAAPISKIAIPSEGQLFPISRKRCRILSKQEETEKWGYTFQIWKQ